MFSDQKLFERINEKWLNDESNSPDILPFELL